MRHLRALLTGSPPTQVGGTTLAPTLEALSAREKQHLIYRWPVWARDEQLPPDWDWTIWLLLGGRGSGKTRAGAEWVRAIATGDPAIGLGSGSVGRIALVGETYADVRDVMIEGESGLLALHPPNQMPNWQSSRRRLEWPNGAVAQIYSSEDPDALRGPQFEAAWCDELCKWKHAEETWNMLQFGLRLGVFPRQVVTTTPRPIKLLKTLVADKRTALTRMSTRQNATNLAPDFLSRVVDHYQGTHLGRQELDGEIIDDRPDALWKRSMLEEHRCLAAPELARTVIAVDPPISSTRRSDACGIVAAGLGADDRVYVLQDRSAERVTPAGWAAIACELYDDTDADCLVVETNQGGDMVESVLRQIRPDLPIRQVKATRGKWLRAEPVAHLYERGLVSHVGCMPQLEDELCEFAPNGLPSGASPDRLDALVWAITDLKLKSLAHPRARTL